MKSSQNKQKDDSGPVPVKLGKQAKSDSSDSDDD